MLHLPADLRAHPTEEALEELVVTGRREHLAGEARSASEGVVGKMDLAIRPLLRPGDVLEAVPGLIVTQHSGSGKSNQMFLRGFNLDHGTDFSTAIDGMPVNLRSQGHGQGYTDINFLIPETVARINFVRGPTTLSSVISLQQVAQRLRPRISSAISSRGRRAKTDFIAVLPWAV